MASPRKVPTSPAERIRQDHATCRVTFLKMRKSTTVQNSRRRWLLGCIVAVIVGISLPVAPCRGGDPETLEMLFRWASKEEPVAEFLLGVWFEEGREVPRDYFTAFQYFSDSAEKGFAPAQYQLATLYHQGKGVTKDLSMAAEWYQKAAAKNVAEAQYNLGVMAYSGTGCPKDYSLAFSWFQKAAKNGMPKAQYQLAIMYANGEGVARDFASAVSWLRKSAANGHPEAIRRLAAMKDGAQAQGVDPIRGPQPP